MADQTKRADSRKLPNLKFSPFLRSRARDVSQAEEVAVIAAVLHLHLTQYTQSLQTHVLLILKENTVRKKIDSLDAKA